MAHGASMRPTVRAAAAGVSPGLFSYAYVVAAEIEHAGGQTDDDPAALIEAMDLASREFCWPALLPERKRGRSPEARCVCACRCCVCMAGCVSITVLCACTFSCTFSACTFS